MLTPGPKGVDSVITAGEIGGDYAVAAKGGIQAAVRVIACQRKVSTGVGHRKPCCHELIIGLNGEGESGIHRPSRSVVTLPSMPGEPSFYPERRLRLPVVPGTPYARA